jgi:hypothetical protein
VGGSVFQSADRFLPIREAMPTLIAVLIASLAGWLVESPLHAILGPISALAVSFVVSASSYFLAKRFASNIRGG